MRLIDIDAVIKNALTDTEREYLKSIARNAPTIDAVPVVRCKDCRWRDAEEKHHCIDINRVFDPMDFCSFGEREDNESNGD